MLIGSPDARARSLSCQLPGRAQFDIVNCLDASHPCDGQTGRQTADTEGLDACSNVTVFSYIYATCFGYAIVTMSLTPLPHITLSIIVDIVPF